MASLSYFFGEATASLRRDRGSKLLAILTIALAFFVLGVFLLVTSSLDRLTATWSASAEMSVYLRDDASDDQRAAIEAALAVGNLIERREFVSKAEAARRFRRDFPDLAASAEGLTANPLPASFELRLRPAAMTTPETERLARTMTQMAGVADVRYDRQWLDRLAKLISALRWVGLSLASALAVAAALTVAAVVRLGMFGRRDEVEIMALVGAPFGAIRGPFVIEGILQGGIGALIALVALRGVYELLRIRLATDLPGLDVSLLHFLPVVPLLGIVAGGMIVGCLGGLVATRGVR